MPFTSEKQRRLCWFLYEKDKKAGKTPKWDCEEWEKHTQKRTSLPERKESRKSSKKSSKGGRRSRKGSRRGSKSKKN